jgi:uncharacterized phage protein (TIGR02220 family)
MHHYPFHVGDYIRATAHLDLIEDCVYRRLIDLYMETESPIPNETQQVIRRLRLGSSGLILDSILNEFFTLEDDNCWHNSRCDAEISAYKRLAEVSRINGKLGGRPKKTQQVILANPEITQQEPSRLQPRTNNQEPIYRESNTLSANADVARKKLNGTFEIAKELLEFLNKKTGKGFRPVLANLEPISARLKEGFSPQDIKTVIARKCMEWGKDDLMSKYLRPATLFNRSKFAQYNGECVTEE